MARKSATAHAAVATEPTLVRAAARVCPLPIPDATEADRADIAARAERLPALHSERRDLLAEIGRRMSVVPVRARHDDWLFPDLPALAHLDGKAKKRREEELNGRLDRLGESLRPGVSLDANFQEGELRFLIDGAPAIERVFLRADEGVFVLAQWKLASSFAITDGTTGKKLADALRKVALTAPDAVREQIIDRELALSAVEAEIAAAEAEMSARVCRLYALTPEEIRLVEAG